MLKVVLADNIIRFLIILLNFLYNIYITRLISPEIFGLSAYILYFSNFYIFTQLGVEYYYYSSKNKGLVIGNYLLVKVLYLTLIDLAIISYIFMYDRNNNHIIPYILFLLLSQTIMEFFSYKNLLLIDALKFGFINFIKITSFLLSISISFFLIQHQLYLEGILALRYVDQIFSTLLTVLITKKSYINFKLNYHEIINIINFGWKNILANFVSKIYSVIDIFWLSINLNYTIVGYYSKATQLIGYVQLMLLSTVISYLPKILSIKNFNMKNIKLILGPTYVLIFAIYLVALLFSRDFILFFFGDNWTNSYETILLFIPFYVVLTVEYLLFEFAKCTGLINKYLIFKAILVLFSLPLFLLINFNGVILLAIVFLIISFISVIFLLIILNCNVLDFIKLFIFYFIPAYIFVYIYNILLLNIYAHFILSCILIFAIYWRFRKSILNNFNLFLSLRHHD